MKKVKKIQYRVLLQWTCNGVKSQRVDMYVYIIIYLDHINIFLL